MKLHLKKTSIALAVATVSGVTLAAPNPFYGFYGTPTTTSTTGTLSSADNAGVITHNFADVSVGNGYSVLDDQGTPDTKATGVQDTYFKNTTTVASATGVVTKTQNVTEKGQSVSGQFVPTVGTKVTEGQPTYALAKDDLTKVVDAYDNTLTTSIENIGYQFTSNAAGTVKTSKQTDGILTSNSNSRSDQFKDNDLQVDKDGKVVAFKLSADKKSLQESTVSDRKSSNFNKTVIYDDVVALARTTETQLSHDNTDTSLLGDDFGESNKGSYEEKNTYYKDGKDAVSSIKATKSSSEIKTRDLLMAKDKNGADIYATTADGKPVVDKITETKSESETYDSVYQPTRYTADDAKRGITKGDAYNTQILNNGVPTSWTDSDTQKSVSKSTSNKTITHKQDNNFQEHWNSTTENTAEYARNQQENIEVNRDILESSTRDIKKLSKIAGVSVVKEAQDSDFKIGTVAVDVDGNKFDVNDVRTWKDETGKERYYVVIDQDANGQDIRSEVTFKNGKPLETKAAELQTVKTEVGSRKRTDKVTMGAEVAYQTNDKRTWDNKETSKDGNTVYDADKGSDETNVKVFSVGKNALHREAVETISRETVDTEFETINVGGTDQVIFKDGKPVVLSVDSNKLASSVTDRLFQDGQDKANEQIKTSSYEGNRKNAAGVVQGTWAGHDNSTTVDYAAGKELAKTIVKDKADEATSKAVTTNVGFNYDGTAKANIGSNTLRDNGTVDAGLAVKDAKAGDIVVDTKLNISNKEDTKTYQDGGVKALESTTVATNVQTVTYADGTTGTLKDVVRDVNGVALLDANGNEIALNQESTVTLFNKGKADKYREAVNTTQVETTGKTYKTDADGDIILANGKPVEQGTSSDKQTVKTTENLYQIGQERKTDTVVVTDTSEKTANVDGSGRDLTAKATDERIEYRAGQKDGKESEVNGTTSSELKVTNTDKTGYTYKVNGKTSNVTNATEMHLLATRDVKSVQKSEWTESLAASGKNAVSITRGNEVVNRTDESRTGTVYGSETVTAATGTTTVAKKEVGVTDKFGTFESSTLSRTETKVAADKSSTVNTKTRAESVDGVVLTSTQTNTDAAGKAVTSTRTTSLNSTTGLTTDQITLNGKDLQTELNHMGNNIDKVQKTAYRGIAIALAAQQAVPSIQPGQVAVFGGVGHYEGETAGSIGVVTSFTDRISASGAFGFAGGNEFGGRVGVAYVFGGK
jgi:hypothetical protein